MFTKNDIKKRFERTTGGAFQGIDVITDKVTGVQYLLVTRDTGAGLTPLIDGDGKPVLSKTETDKEKSVSDKYVSPFWSWYDTHIYYKELGAIKARS